MCNIFLSKNSIKKFKIYCSNEQYFLIENPNKLPPAVREILSIINTIFDIRTIVREFWGEYFTADDIIYADEVIKKIDDFAIKQLDYYKNIQIMVKNKNEIIKKLKNNENYKCYIIKYNNLYENIFKMIIAFKYKDDYDNNPQAILKYFKAVKKELLEYRNLLLKLLFKKLNKNMYYKKSIQEIIKKEFKNGN